MITQRVILAAVIVFLLAWGTLTMLAVRSSHDDDTRPSAPAVPSGASGLNREEIAKHDRADDCWIVIRGKVYDVTRYIASHPAPRRAITDHCGKESTRAFETKERGRSHSSEAWQLLERYLVGEARD